MSLVIVERYYHQNGNCAPFVVAVVDDTDENDTKLVIMFDEEELTAVLSLDTIIESEDVSPEGNSHRADKYDRLLRDHLWNMSDDDIDLEDEDDEFEIF